MLAWLRDLTSRERRTMLACWGGWTLDGFDQQLYSLLLIAAGILDDLQTALQRGDRERFDPLGGNALHLAH